MDGDYITDLVLTVLQRGGYNRRVSRIAASNMALEGLGQAPPDHMPEIFPYLVRGTIPHASDETIQKIQSLYTYPADLPAKLGWDWVTDITYACNAYYTAKAYAPKAQRYVMSVPPAIHALDQSCEYYLSGLTSHPLVSVGSCSVMDMGHKAFLSYGPVVHVPTLLPSKYAEARN